MLNKSHNVLEQMSLFTQSGLLPAEFERLLGEEYSRVLEMLGINSKSYMEAGARSVLYSKAHKVAVAMDDYMGKAIDYHTRRILGDPVEELAVKQKTMESAHDKVRKEIEYYTKK